MRLVISDVKDFPCRADDTLISPDGTKKMRHCVGCFGCWVKTPGQCVIKDGYENMGGLLGHSAELLILSECVYGGYSPFVKNVLDRSIPYISPFFVIRGGEMHHKQRYDNSVGISAHFYGTDITDKEKTTAVNIVNANALNLYAVVKEVSFHNSADEVISFTFAFGKDVQQNAVKAPAYCFTV